MEKNIRTRFAPSPTGFLHVGGLRTALYSYLYAKQNNGQFIVRIEDTDQARLVEGATEKIFTTLEWAGIIPDESVLHGGAFGPYVQSDRLHIYKEYCLKLITQKKAYYCFATADELDESRKLQQKQGLQPKYNRKWLPQDMGGTMPQSKINEALDSDTPRVIRMKVPDKTIVTFTDVIRGQIEFDSSTIDDQVLLKSDGFPTYHLAVVVDDHLMEISTIIRGEEWLSSTPKHILLYEFFGWEKPVFAHVPLLLNPDGSKLSKRQGDVAVEDYREKGYTAEALVNFVALLGWNEGAGVEKEIYSMDELVQKFSLTRVGKSGAIFNIEKLSWIEKSHIRTTSNDVLATKILPFLETALQKKTMLFAKEKITSIKYLSQVAEQMKERVDFISEFVSFSSYFFFEPTEYDKEGIAKRWKNDTNELLADFISALKSDGDFTSQSIEQCLKKIVEIKGKKTSDLVHPVRIAITGVTFGPSLYHAMEIIGKEICLLRLDKMVSMKF